MENLADYPVAMRKWLVFLVARILGMLVLLATCAIIIPRGESIPVTTRIYLGVAVVILLGITFWGESKAQGACARLVESALRSNGQGLSSEDFENLWRGYKLRPYLRRSGMLLETDVEMARLMKGFLERDLPMTPNAKEVLGWLKEKVAYLKYEDPKTDWSWLESSEGQAGGRPPVR